MIDLLLVSLVKNGSSPIIPTPAPANPTEWGSTIGAVADELGENIYFVGGNNSSGSNRRAMSYNVIDQAYTEYPALPDTVTPTNYFQVWCKSGTLYANRSGKMYRLDPGAASWVQLADPSNSNNMPAYGGATLIYNGRLLCYGLLASPGYENALCEYLPDTNSFVRVAINPLKPIMTYTSLNVLGTKFYMMNVVSDKLDVYDIVSNTWTSTATTPVIYRTRGQADYNGKVVLFGGNTSTFELTTAYDTTTGQFSNLPPMKITDSTALFVTAGDAAYSLQYGKLLSYKLE